MSFSFFDVLLIIGITQGLVAVASLLFSRQKSLSNVFLSLAILSFCLLFVKILLIYTGLTQTSAFRYLPISFELVTAPLFYLYLRALTEKSFTWKRTCIFHFVPFLIAYGFSLFIFTAAYFNTTVVLQDSSANQWYYHQIKAIEDWAIVASIIFYLYLGSLRFKTFQQQIKESNADNAYPTLKWLRYILVSCAILCLYLVVNMLISRFTNIETMGQLHWKIYYIYIAGFTYYIGLMSYRQKEPDLSKIFQKKPVTTVNPMNVDESKKLALSFQCLLENEHIYVDPTLNLNQVAERLEVTPSNLSQAINAHLDKNFRELINLYRIEMMKVKLLDSENTASILSLALETGFNSEASFYRVFKNNTGLSPTQYKKAQTNPN